MPHPAPLTSYAAPRHWDLFCKVVDNFGDAGVCWRLARQLVNEQQQSVSLWVDDLPTLARLDPSIDPSQHRQTVAGVDIARWTADHPQFCHADVVVEAFACELPEPYVQSLAMRVPHPCWINLEYLSAEDWVDGYHGLSSPEPRLGIAKHFFFPGFSEQTGGLLWGQPEEKPVLHPMWPTPTPDQLLISLFSYDHVAFHGLLQAWSNSPIPIHCLVPPGKPRQLVEQALGSPLEYTVTQGQLTLTPLPFLAQSEYDQLLQACDLNFVRGEDSFVRAQWAGKPMVWQIYWQEALAHQPKLEAFLKRYCAGLPHTVAKACSSLHHYWNDPASHRDSVGFAEHWQAWLAALPALREHAQNWQQHFASRPGLAENLVKFSCLRV